MPEVSDNIDGDRLNLWITPVRRYGRGTLILVDDAATRRSYLWPYGSGFVPGSSERLWYSTLAVATLTGSGTGALER